MYVVDHYVSAAGRDVYSHWVSKLRNRSARVAVARRVSRMKLGNFGDHKPCRDGVWELRIDIGAGYRGYYAMAGTRIIVLLRGGDKSTQTSDIDRACASWAEWRRRNRDEG